MARKPIVKKKLARPTYLACIECGIEIMELGTTFGHPRVACEICHSRHDIARRKKERKAFIALFTAGTNISNGALRWLATRDCKCDYDTGYAPCERCSAIDELKKLDKALTKAVDFK